MSETSVTSKSPTVTISQDRMQAILRIPADVSADMLNADSLMALLVDTGIPDSEDVRENVAAAIAQFKESPDHVRRVVAQGIAPQRGEDGRLEWQGEFGPNANTADHEAEDEHDVTDSDTADDDEVPINYYDQSPFVFVAEDEHVATLIEPTPGLSGFDVFGKRIPPTPGKAFPMRYDGSIEIDALGKVTTTQPGLLMCGYNAVRVSPVLEIAHGVNFSTGNIDFDGTVKIGEGVRDRFTVKASKNIMAEGLIEASNLDCRGTLHSQGGMAGRDVGSFKAGKDAALRYLVGVNGQVGRDLQVQREIINCHLTVGRHLDLGSGCLIGGDVTVDRHVKVGALGSDAAVPTLLRLGRVPALSDMLNRLHPAMGTINSRLKELKQRYEDLLAKPNSDPGLRNQLRHAIDNLAEKREALREQLNELKQRFNAKCRIDLTVIRAIHPGVTLALPRLRIRFVETVNGPVVIRRGEDGKIRIDHPNGEGFKLRQSANVTSTETW